MLYDIGLGNDFLDLTRKTKITKAKINKCYYTKLKIYSAKKTISKMKRQPPEIGRGIGKTANGRRKARGFICQVCWTYS